MFPTRWLVIPLFILLSAIPIIHAQEDCGSEYVVQPGDNLTVIAQRCGTTVDALREANPEVFSRILPGDVLALEVIPEVPPGPAVLLTPTTATVGATVNATVSSFPPNVNVRAGLGVPGQTAILVNQGTTDANGAFSTQFTIPAGTAVGLQLYVSVQTANAELVATSNPVTITAGGSGGSEPALVPTIEVFTPGIATAVPTVPTATPVPNTAQVITIIPAPTNALLTPPFSGALAPIPTPVGFNQFGTLFNQVNVYMVIPGDNGQRGPVFGCNDSLVAVQIAVPETVAPLTAGIDALLENPASTYGLADVVNPMADTDLEIVNIFILNGEAIINLTGSVTSGGTCEDTRLIAQMTATALQYNTVDRLSVYVDGVSLNNLLP